MPKASHPQSLVVQVFAPTFPGYGRSEKPAMAYSQVSGSCSVACCQFLWAQLRSKRNAYAVQEVPVAAQLSVVLGNSLSSCHLLTRARRNGSMSQELWRDFLRDFVVEVVRRPVVAVGNSIGGYISASLAADYPVLVSGESHGSGIGSSARTWRDLDIT